MKKSTIILLIGSIVVFLLAIKWYYTDITSFEPTVTIGSSFFLILSYYFTLVEEKKDNKVESKNPNIKIEGKKNKVTINSNNKTNYENNILSILLVGLIFFCNNQITNCRNKNNMLNKYQLPDYKPFERTSITYPTLPESKFNDYSLIEETFKSLKDFEEMKRHNSFLIEDLILKLAKENPLKNEYSTLASKYFVALQNRNYSLADKIRLEINNLSFEAKKIENTQNSPTFENDKEKLINELIKFDPLKP